MKETLIKDDIKNKRLISGLQNLGIDADFYTSKNTEVIFSLMNIVLSMGIEQMHKQYYDLMQWRFQKDTVSDFYHIANNLYRFLEEYSN